MDKESEYQKTLKYVIFVIAAFCLLCRLFMLFSEPGYFSGLGKLIDILTQLVGIACPAVIGYFLFVGHEDTEKFAGFAVGGQSLFDGFTVIPLLIVYIKYTKGTDGMSVWVVIVLILLALLMFFTAYVSVMYSLDRVTCIPMLLLVPITLLLRNFIFGKADSRLQDFGGERFKETLMTPWLFLQMLFFIFFIICLVVYLESRFLGELKDEPKKIFSKNLIFGTYTNLYKNEADNYVEYNASKYRDDEPEKVSFDKRESWKMPDDVQNIVDQVAEAVRNTAEEEKRKAAAEERTVNHPNYDDFSDSDTSAHSSAYSRMKNEMDSAEEDEDQDEDDDLDLEEVDLDKFDSLKNNSAVSRTEKNDSDAADAAKTEASAEDKDSSDKESTALKNDPEEDSEEDEPVERVLDNRFYEIDAKEYPLTFDKFSVESVKDRAADDEQFEKIVKAVNVMSREEKLEAAHKLNAFIYFAFNKMLEDDFSITGSLIDFVIMLSSFESFRPSAPESEKVPEDIRNAVKKSYDGLFPDDYIEGSLQDICKLDNSFYNIFMEKYSYAGDILLMSNLMGNQFLTANFTVMLILNSFGLTSDTAERVVRMLRNECLDRLSSDETDDDSFILDIAALYA